MLLLCVSMGSVRSTLRGTTSFLLRPATLGGGTGDTGAALSGGRTPNFPGEGKKGLCHTPYNRIQLRTGEMVK